ncbi:MAG: DUF378 domain-containing protein [Deltaproteobacteria bacterium]
MIRVRQFGFMRWVDVLAFALLVLGGLYLGVGAVFGFTVVGADFAEVDIWARIIFLLIGLSALYEIFEFRAIARRWNCTLVTKTAGGSAR